MISEPIELTASQLLRAYRERTLSPVEAVDACLTRIDEVDPLLNATVTVCADTAVEAARRAERRWRDGSAAPFEGVPFGLKDIIATAGVRTTAGSPMFAEYVPDRDATVAKRLLEAGGILLAKLQTSEFATAPGAFGVIRNPWDVERIPAGSSSGSAVAVAARELPVALGTDTGGSIRIPSAFCGLTSLKPTFGRISRAGVFPLSWTLDHVGPMARSAEDIGLLLSVLAGHDPLDPSSSKRPLDAYRAVSSLDSPGLRIGVPDEWFFDLCDRQVRDAVFAALEVLESLGATTRPVSLPMLEDVDVVELGRLIIRAECASLHEVNLARLDKYGPAFADQVVEGCTVNAVDYLRALRLRTRLQAELADVFRDVDVLVTPGAIGVAPLEADLRLWIDGVAYPWLTPIMRTSTPFNVAGVPALVMPVGRDRDGLPLSIQVVGAPFDEVACLRVAHVYQQATGHHEAAPTVPEHAGRAR